MAVAAVERVFANAALQLVVARAAAENVVMRVTRQGVGLRAAQQVLDVGVLVTRSVAGVVLGVQQRSTHARLSAGIAGGVVAFAADQLVRAAAAVQRVVALATNKHVGPAVATKRVSKVAAHQVLDVDQHVALGLTARVQTLLCAGRVHGHACGRCGVAGGVGAGAAVERVCTHAADQGVVAPAAVDGVVATEAAHDVVAVSGVDDVVGSVIALDVVAHPTGEQVKDGLAVGIVGVGL